MRILKTPPEPMIVRRDPARPLFAIGDVHGHADALSVLLGYLDAEIEARYRHDEIDLVFLGDFVDRGPQPLETLRLVARGLERPLVRETALMGNHDFFLVAAARLAGRKMGPTDWATWMANGGGETLQGLGARGQIPSAASLQEALGEDLCAFLGGLSLTYRSGDILCVHAGVDPARELDEQIEQDLIWVREPFLSLAADAEAPWTIGVTVVHGHTPSAWGAFAHRIGADTGGYSSGVFTAVEIWDGAVQFHHLRR